MTLNMNIKQVTFVEKKHYVNEECKEEIHYGKCRMGMQLWLYNSSVKECSEFISGGCDKGPLFMSRKECNKTCLEKPKQKKESKPSKKAQARGGERGVKRRYRWRVL